MERNIESYESVKRWFDNLTADRPRVRATLYQYKSAIQKFVAFAGKDPDTIIKERKEQLKSDDITIQRKAEELAKAFLNEMQKKVSRNSAILLQAAVRSFYKYNYYPLQFKTPQKTEILKRGPDKEELISMWTVADETDRAILAVAKDSGISRQDLLMLKYRDIKKEFEAGKLPICVMLVRVKEQVKYNTFLGREAYEALRVYFTLRERKGEKIADDTRLFPIWKQGISTRMSRLLKRAGLSNLGLQPIHMFRKFHETNLATAKVHPLICKFWEGHKIRADVDSRYIIPTVEEQRKLYVEAYDALALFKTERGLSEKQTKLEIVKKVCAALGLGDLTPEIRIDKNIMTVDDEIAFYERLIHKRQASGGLSVANIDMAGMRALGRLLKQAVAMADSNIPTTQEG